MNDLDPTAPESSESSAEAEAEHIEANQLKEVVIEVQNPTPDENINRWLPDRFKEHRGRNYRSRNSTHQF